MVTRGGRVLAVAGLAACLLWPSSAPAQSAPSLGAAASFAVLGGTSVSSNGSAAHISGNVGVSPGKTVTGFPKEIFALGEVRNDLAAEAQRDSAKAYADLAGRSLTANLTGQVLGGMKLTRGVYNFDGGANLGGPLILDAAGDSNAVWIFRIGANLTTAPKASVLLIRGGRDINVFWEIAGSATVEEGTGFAGNILALNNIVLRQGARLAGRALARTGSVTLTDNDVSLCCVPTTLTPDALPQGAIGKAYEATIAAVAPGSYTYSISSGSLPPGLDLATDGRISGEPKAKGKHSFTVTATSGACSTTVPYTIEVKCGCLPITVLPEALSPTDGCVAFDETIRAEGGTGSYVFTASKVDGLTLSPQDEKLFGTPKEPGCSPLTVTATDDCGCSGSRTYPVCPTLTVMPKTLPDGTVGVPYSEPLKPAGAKFLVCEGTPPPDLWPTGETFSGTPIRADTYKFTITAIDANRDRGSREYTVTIRTPCPSGLIISPGVIISPSLPLPSGRVGVPYDGMLQASGGKAPYKFTPLASPPFPPGLKLYESGKIHGTPTLAGTYTFPVTVTDSTPCTLTVPDYTITIEPCPIDFLPASLPSASLCQFYEETFTPSGYLYEALTPLPPGLSLTPDGVLSGTPTKADDYTVTIRATDKTPGCYRVHVYSLPVTGDGGGGNSAITIMPYLLLPFGTQFVPYGPVMLMASGGTPPYTFEEVIGSGMTLPPGLTLSPGGAISGTPTQNGSYRFTIRVRDAGGNCLGDRFTYSIAIYPIP